MQPLPGSSFVPVEVCHVVCESSRSVLALCSIAKTRCSRRLKRVGWHDDMEDRLGRREIRSGIIDCPTGTGGVVRGWRSRRGR